MSSSNFVTFFVDEIDERLKIADLERKFLLDQCGMKDVKMCQTHECENICILPKPDCVSCKKIVCEECTAFECFGCGDKLLCAMCDSKGKNEWVQSCGFCSEKVICDQCNDIEKCYYCETLMCKDSECAYSIELLVLVKDTDKTPLKIHVCIYCHYKIVRTIGMMHDCVPNAYYTPTEDGYAVCDKCGYKQCHAECPDNMDLPKSCLDEKYEEYKKTRKH